MNRRGLLFATPLLLLACTGDPVPRPKGWLRLDLPEQAYRAWAADCPFRAEIPDYARAVPRPKPDSSCWIDLLFPGQRAEVHLTYVPVHGDLGRLVRDAHDLKATHEPKATRIANEHVVRDSARVFGTLFDLEGDVASPMIFYLTDSTDHFLYGALYFNARPNADSLAPVIERLRKDMRHFVGTLAWE